MLPEDAALPDPGPFPLSPLEAQPAMAPKETTRIDSAAFAFMIR
jgi:hypothetical protein